MTHSSSTVLASSVGDFNSPDFNKSDSTLWGVEGILIYFFCLIATAARAPAVFPSGSVATYSKYSLLSFETTE